MWWWQNGVKLSDSSPSWLIFAITVGCGYVSIPFFVTPGSGWVGFLVVVVVVVGVPVVVISPVFLLSNKLPQTVYILFPLNGPDEDQQESHRKGDSCYCSFVGMGGGALWSFWNGWCWKENVNAARAQPCTSIMMMVMVMAVLINSWWLSWPTMAPIKVQKQILRPKLWGWYGF